ncbi:uncharacterized protein EI90DRAFT_1026447 [Cantharellus anzutake]|uniref:uncharacterized protein n=1 Tax=Cantharellus anzutake TaxID=1750568 RepID=UPI001904D793|nr:uncharacterized protein EI90DRAFT_1026447 [Cantharellus anzutake]KAF8331484.1 hypothetical protein EI90DRAFT_1026447 [Cantharellus anzutake]
MTCYSVVAKAIPTRQVTQPLFRGREIPTVAERGGVGFGKLRTLAHHIVAAQTSKLPASCKDTSHQSHLSSLNRATLTTT